MQAALSKHLSDLCDWTQPDAGMFFWLRLKNAPRDTLDVLRERANRHGVHFVPGLFFDVLDGGDGPCQYMRVAFAVASEEEMWLATERLKNIILEEMQVEKANSEASNTVSSNGQADEEDRRHVFNDLSLRRKPMAITSMKSMEAEAPPGTIALSVGTPNAEGYPFARLKLTLRDGEIQLEG